MRINSLKLTQFRNHISTTLELERLNVITGRNNSGKTSLVYALEVALTGRCAATDRGGRGLDDLVCLGQKAAAVELDVDGLGAVTRTITPKGSSLQVAGWEGSMKMQQDLLYEHLEADADLITNLLNVSAFLRLPAKEQQEMLFTLASPGFTPEGLELALGERLSAALSALWGAPEHISPDDLDEAYRATYAARAAAKKELAAAQGALGVLDGDKVPDGLPAPEELPDIQADLERVEAEHSALLTRIAEARAASRRLDELVARRTELERRLKDLGEEGPPPDDIDGIAAELEEAMADHDIAVSAGAEFAGRIRGVDESIKAVKKATSKCPIAPTAVKCPLSKDDRKALVDKLEIERAKLVKEHEAAIKEQTTHNSTINELRGQVERARAAATAAAKRDEAQATLAELEAEAAGIQTVDTRAMEEEAGALEERISKGHALVAQVGQAAGRERQLAEASEKVAALAERVKDLEELVAMLGAGPGGVKAKLMADLVDVLGGTVSNNLRDLTGGAYRVSIEVDPEFRILINNGTTCVEPKHLSTSERFRVGIAFAVELARMSRLGLLVIDDAEVLDAENRALLSGYLDGLADFSTIILLATKDEAQEMNQVEGMSFWWIEAGSAWRLDLVGVGV